MKSCVIYFSNKIKNLLLAKCFIEVFLENNIKNKIIDKICLIKNKNTIKFINLFNEIAKKYEHINFEICTINENDKFKILQNYDMIINNEKIFFKNKKPYYEKSFIENINHNISLINLNIIEIVTNYLTLNN